MANAASAAELLVRAIRTDKHGTCVAIVNTGFEAKRNLSVKLPATGTVHDGVIGEEVPVSAGAFRLTLDPAELRTLRVR